MALRWGIRVDCARRWLAAVSLALGGACMLHAQEIDRMPRNPNSPLNRPLLELRHINVTGSDASHGGFTAIAQSANGFLWLASSVGLLRFDGVRFDDSYAGRLPKLSINTLYVDGNDDVWVGYFSGGLSRIRGEAISNFPSGGEVPNGTLYTILRGPDGLLWAASTHGVIRLVGEHWVGVGESMGYKGGRPRSLQMIDGVLWIMDDEHGWYLKPGQSHFEMADRDQHIAQEWQRTGAPARPYNDGKDGNALVDSSGSLWLAQPEGLERDRWVTGPDGQTQRIVETFGAANGLSGNGVESLFEDREGNVWVATRQGLDQFRATNLRPMPLPGNVQLPFVVAGADGQVWIPAGWQPPFLVANGETKPYPELPNILSTGTRDKQGVVWLAGLYGVFRNDRGKVSKIAWPASLKNGGASAQAIAMDDDGVLWVSVALHGLYQFKDGHWTERDTSAYGHGGPVYMLNDASGRFWQVYPHAMVAVIDKGITKVYGAREGLVGDLLALAANTNHVWVGGDSGVFLLRGERFVQVKGKGGQHFRIISGIVETPAGDLWLNGLDGAYRIEAAELARLQNDPTYEVAYRFFGPDDGRVGVADHSRPVPTLVMSDDGRLWFSTSTVVSWVYPRQIRSNSVAPTVVIQSLSDGESRYDGEGTVQLKPLTRKVSIDYTTAALANPSRVRFRYRLDGVDHGWQDAGGQRTASYANLGPGSYTFHVEAINEDGVRSQGDDALNFVIEAAWYQTLAFKLMCGLLVLVLLAAAHRYRMQQEAARIRLGIQARDEERDRIARDLHDTLLQSVQGLVLHFQSVAGRLGPDTPTRLAMESALDRADKVVAEARGRVLDLRAKTRGDLHDVLKATGAELTADQPMQFKALIEGRPRELTTQVYWEVLAIAKEAMFNAFQHSNGSLLEVEVAYLSHALRVRLRDNGVGVPAHLLQDGRPNHWGISGMRERAEKVSAKFRIWSREGEGCEIEVLVPASVAYRTQVGGFQWLLDRMLQWARG